MRRTTRGRHRRVRGRRRMNTMLDDSKEDEVRQHRIPHPDRDESVKPNQLNQVIDRILEATNPNAPENITRFNFIEKKYKLEPSVEQMAVHYSFDGILIPVKGEEARIQGEILEKKRLEREEKEKEGRKTLHNQFNYSQRATQTFNNPTTSCGVVTEPPPTMTFEATATQWEIYDTYEEHFKQQQLAESKKQKHKKRLSGEKQAESSKKKKDEDILGSRELLKTLQIVDRMVNQNTHHDLLEDYKFWYDKSDQYKQPKTGTLLPLWNFYSNDSKRKQVTSLCWNPKYNDLFAVSYGSYDFLKQGDGLICCFSLKNPSSPEYQFKTDVGVTSIDFHPNFSSLLCVGTYDGVVSIYDIREKPKSNPIIRSDVKNGKHIDAVWDVKWDTDSNVTNPLSFYSVAADGRVTNWAMSKNELQYNDVMKLKMDTMVDQFEVDTSNKPPKNLIGQTISGLSSGTCFDFNRKNPHLFLVGTEEGTIHQCSKSYNSQYLYSYEGHDMSVYGVKWNYFVNNLFLSASADWTVKLWDVSKYEPLMTFDLQSAVGDVAWAPYSSSVFAAVTSDGKVHVYDLKINTTESLCDQLIVKRAKLTHVRFNHKEPIILVGDDKGLVQILKLSPNLIMENKDPKWQF